MDFCQIWRGLAIATLIINVVACNDTTTGTATGANTGDGGVGSGNGNGNGTGSGNGNGNGNGTGTGGGQARTLGPDMTAAPASEWRCSDGYPIQINPSFPQPFNEPGAQSCTLITFLPPVSPALGSGTAVSANIKVGATTGPMRFARMRLLYQHGTGPKCCSLQEYGTEFTPRANSTTTVPLNFKMLEEATPPPNDNTIIANDVIALEVLSPATPIPGHWPSNGAQVPNIANYLYLPSLSSQNAPAPNDVLLNYTAGFSGFVPLFTISYVPD